MSKPDKWEAVRCFRHGDFIKLFRHRWGHALPDDDAGRADLWLLVCNASLARREPEKKMRHLIEVWAPWMTAEECSEYVKHVWGLDFYRRLMTGREIGEQLGLTNATREALKIRQFKPTDMTDEELVEQRKAKQRERMRRARNRDGITPSRSTHLAKFESQSRPWEALGIHRRTWERRRAALACAIIVSKAAHTPAAPSSGEAESGFQAGALVKDRAIQVAETGEVETYPSSSPGLRTRLRRSG